MKGRTRSTGMLLAALVICDVAHSQNLVSNPDFDSDTNGWLPNAAIVAFDATQNIVGATPSGSLSMVNSVANGFSVAVRQCIAGPIPPGTYDFGAWIRMPTGQTGVGVARAGVGAFSGASCSSLIGGFAFTDSVGATGQWALQTNTFSVPAGTASVALTLEIASQPGNPNPIQAYFDGARFGVAPTVPIELQSFDVD